MKKKYTQKQITKALLLVNKGMTRPEAAKKAGINVFSLHYYLAKKASPKTRQLLLRPKKHIKAIHIELV